MLPVVGAGTGFANAALEVKYSLKTSEKTWCATYRGFTRGSFGGTGLATCLTASSGAFSEPGGTRARFSVSLNVAGCVAEPDATAGASPAGGAGVADTGIVASVQTALELSRFSCLVA